MSLVCSGANCEAVECDPDGPAHLFVNDVDFGMPHPFFGVPTYLSVHGKIPLSISGLPTLIPIVAPSTTTQLHTGGQASYDTGASAASLPYYQPADAAMLHAPGNGSVVRGQIVIGTAMLKDSIPKFAFYNKGNTVQQAQNLNRHLTDPLTDLVEHYKELEDVKSHFQASGTTKAISFLMRLPRRIQRMAELDDILESLPDRSHAKKHIGDKTRAKISLLLDGQPLPQLAFKDESLARNARLDFQKIHGIGPVKCHFGHHYHHAAARQLVLAGVTSIKDLKARVFGTSGVPPDPPCYNSGGRGRTLASPILGDDAIKCLQHYEDLNTRIPRDEVTEIVEFVRAAAHKALCLGSDKLLVVCCGSYRRGRPSSGDVDILIAPQTPLRAGAPLPIAPILKELTSSGFLVDQLGAGGHDWARSARECTFMNDHERRETFEQYRTVAEEQPHSYSLPVALDRRGLVNAAHGPMPNRSKRLASLVSLRGQPPKVARIEPAHERQTGAAKAIADELLRVRNSDVGCTRVVAYEDVEWLPQSEYDMSTFMGLCRLPPGPSGATRRVRRLDIKSYPREVFAFAIMYFTGSDYFNRSMRSYVKQTGWSLSDQGLRLVRYTDGLTVKAKESSSIRADTEEDIFAALGLPYRTPEQRDCDGSAAARTAAGDIRNTNGSDDDSQAAKNGTYLSGRGGLTEAELAQVRCRCAVSDAARHDCHLPVNLKNVRLTMQLWSPPKS